MFVLLSGLLAATASVLLLGQALTRRRHAGGQLRLVPLAPWSGLGPGSERRVARFRVDAPDPDLSWTALSARSDVFGLDDLPRPGLAAFVRLGFGDDLPLGAVRDVHGSELLVELDLRGDPRDRRGLHAATLDLTWQTYGRHGWASGGTTLVVPLGRSAEPPLPSPFAEGTLLPVPTRLVVPGDDLAGILAGALAGRVRPGDCLAVSESALAIAQGRLRWPRWDAAPSRLAGMLCRAFPPASSLATPHGMQAALDEAGPARVLLALGLGAVTRLFGLRGVFYRVAGPRVALIDDVGGTLPPFDRAVVLAPQHPHVFASDLARRTGAEVAVVDANALGVRVVASTPGVDPRSLAVALASNPHGNGLERTPVVRVRWSRTPGTVPLPSREGVPC